MKKSIVSFSAAAMMLALGTAAHAQTVEVTVDGQPAVLNPAPLERAGRIFVPLRGVFERLGASVVYEDGTINATGNGRTISLHIGSTTASVNGRSKSLDVAPFIVGASTYVPLRFVAQALGASVNWDNAGRIVALGTNRPMMPTQDTFRQGPPERQEAPARSTLGLANREPSLNADVQSNRPTIAATFTGRANPNTLKVSLDQLDITSSASRSPSGVVYSPESDLQPMRHTVRVTGQDTQGAPFDLQWSFVSGRQVERNEISDVTPEDGAGVGSFFIVRGHTMPGSHVTIEVGSGAEIGNALSFATGSFRGDTLADSNGNFTEDVRLNALPGGFVNLIVSSTAPVTRASAPQIRRRLSVRN